MEFTEQKSRIQSLRLILLGGTVFFLVFAIHFFAPARADLWWQTFFESLHAPAFGVIAVCLLAMTPSTWHSRARIIVSLVATLLLALLSEAMQIPMPNRSASFHDLFNDIVGALAFVAAAIVLSPSFHVPRGRGRWLVLLAATLLIWPFKPLADVSLAYWERYEQLPSIVPLNGKSSRAFFHLNNAEVRFAHFDDGATVGTEFLFGESGASSINFHDPWSNWRPYETLVLEIDNLGDKALRLVIRVHDEAHLHGNQPHEDRFNRQLELVPGRQTIRFDIAEIEASPAGRKMDIGRIDGLVLFSNDKDTGGRFVIQDIRLE